MQSLDLLNLPNNPGLTGTFEHIAALPKLQVLHTYGSGIRGDLPVFASTELELLAISNQELTGTIPPQWGLLSKMTQLWMAGNMVSGPIPATLANWTALTLWDTRDNVLSGTLPPELGAGWSKLVRFKVDNNRLSGELPRGFNSLVQLDVSGNMFTGSLDIMCDSPALDSVDAANNALYAFPDSCALTSTSLDLSSNNFAGQLPAGIGNVAGLKHLSLASNSLSIGPVPLSWANLEPSLISLDLSHNAIAADVTSFLVPFRTFSALQRIDISHNKLFGEMLSSLFLEVFPVPRNFLQPLVSLYINNNQISGNVPEWVDLLPSILEFDGSANNFTGSVDRLTGYVQSVVLSDTPGLGEADGASLPPNLVPVEPFSQHRIDKPYSCPAFVDVRMLRSSVVLDPAYYGYHLCRCFSGFHGSAGKCHSCEPYGSAVRCEGGRVELPAAPIQDERIGRGLGTASLASIATTDTAAPTESSSDAGPYWGGAEVHPGTITIQPNYYVAGKTASGMFLLDECYPIGVRETSCNPQGLDEYTCREGYRGRVCSRCETGYYLQGRRCEVCPSALPVVLAVVYTVTFLAWFGVNQTRRKSVFTRRWSSRSSSFCRCLRSCSPARRL
ncbi:uncharacterized protein AMSG_00556 [Thecamonas trahens ATCC 50062]|uniref:EGF-like domain-containing protein n=1 Tax=Thecamonas trahens ATCC 50062 TaxID=461836 RepID=A0A0L0DBU7_THETB|nr:hypothetical protein AMSG_00556 [Thecamonas trahens ATCC 50062]KNC48778.1 hypothetical protein AMSG_00556 [Thecamonas trahens ATCC 50062]|eukprot:XP_013762829.1 hypothetical protein AMSG_00556 [Thecamonas trahens ATCC 50062]